MGFFPGTNLFGRMRSMTEALTITNPVTPAHYKKSAASRWRGSHRGLYQALKAFGQPLKSLFILRVIDEPVLRMSINALHCMRCGEVVRPRTKRCIRSGLSCRQGSMKKASSHGPVRRTLIAAWFATAIWFVAMIALSIIARG
jgi:hypothetical protein